MARTASAPVRLPLPPRWRSSRVVQMCLVQEARQVTASDDSQLSLA
jgi:hypothetical protein